MKSKRLIIIIGISALVLLIVLAVGKKQGWFGNEGYLKVAVETGIEREILEVITANGKIQPETEVAISPDVSGEIVDLCRNIQVESTAILQMGHNTPSFAKDLRINGSILCNGTCLLAGVERKKGNCSIC